MCHNRKTMNNIEDSLDELNEYMQSEMDDIEKNVSIDSKMLDECLKEQLPLQLKWERIVAELSIVYSEAKQIADNSYSEAFKKSGENSYGDIPTTDKKYSAACSKKYQKYKGIENKASGLKKRAESVLKTVESRKYILKDLCAAVINGVEKNII